MRANGANGRWWVRAAVGILAGALAVGTVPAVVDAQEGPVTSAIPGGQVVTTACNETVSLTTNDGTLVRSLGTGMYARVSPDGTRVATMFDRYRPPGSTTNVRTITTFPIDAPNEMRRLTLTSPDSSDVLSTGLDWGLGWSPDGTELAYTAELLRNDKRRNGWAIVEDAPGALPVGVTQVQGENENKNTRGSVFEWKDGTWLTVVDSRLATAPARSGAVTIAAPPGQGTQDARLTPDGGVAWWRSTGTNQVVGGVSLVVYELVVDGTPTGATALQPSAFDFSPDGTHVLVQTVVGRENFANITQSFVMPVAGGEAVPFGRRNAFYCSFDWFGSPPPPAPAFTWTEESDTPGEFRFTSTSTDPSGVKPSARWDFGDGATALGDFVTHRYQKPGSYRVTLTARNASGIEASYFRVIEVAAPALSVAVAPPLTPQPVGEPFDVDVTVKAGPGVGPLRGLTFSSDGGEATAPPVLSWAAGVGIVPVAGPTPAPTEPFDLEPGIERTFRLRVQGDKAGTIPLRSSIGGADDAARPVTGSGFYPVRIEGPPAPELRIDLPSSNLEVGDEVTATVRLATGDGLGDLAELRFAAQRAVESSVPDVLEVVSGPAPAVPSGGLVLGPNQVRAFEIGLKAKAAGTADLTSRVGGRTTGSSPKPVGADAAPVTVSVADPGLVLDVVVDQDEFTIDEDRDGPKAQERKVTVTVRNTSGEDLEDVTLQSFLSSWQKGLPFTTGSPQTIARITDGPGDDGLDLGDLSPGESVERTFTLRVADDGHLAVSTAVIATADGRPKRAVGEAKFTAAPKYLMRFDVEGDASTDDNPAEPWNTPDVVGAGKRFLVTGEIENLTTDQRILATAPVTDRRSVSSANLYDLADDDTAADWVPPALPLLEAVDPGSTTAIAAKPTAMPGPQFEGARTDLRVQWAPAGRAQLHDDPDELVGFTGDEVLVDEDRDAVSLPVVWPPDPEPMGASEFYALYTLSFLDSTIAYWSSIGSSAANGVDAFNRVSNQAWLAVSGDPAAQELWRQRFTGAWASFVGTLELARDTIKTLTPAERQQLTTELSNPFMSHLRLGRWAVSNEQTAAAQRALAAAIEKTYADLTSLGDLPPEELAQRLGNGSGIVFGDVTFGMVTDAVIAKALNKFRFGKNLEAAQKYVDDQAKAAAAEGLTIEKGLKGIPAEAHLTDEVLAVGLGLRKAEKDQLLYVAKKYNLRIMARSRGAGAAELIESGRARLKPFGIDAKNVNDIDVQMLGFPAEHLDTVAIKQPKPWADVVADPVYQDLGQAERAQVADRWQKRSKEWSGGGTLKETAPGTWTTDVPVPTGEKAIGPERDKFLKAAATKKIDLQFPTELNWEETWRPDKNSPQMLPLDARRADFALDELEGGTLLRPRIQGTKTGPPIPITGDVDLVALLNPDGTYPAVEKIIAAYRELAQPPLGMQHPATWSFSLEGKSMDLLKDHVFGGVTAEPLAVFDPNGVITAALFHPKMSLIPSDRRANPMALIRVAGGTKIPSHAYGLGAVAPLVFGPQEERLPYYVPERWNEADGRGVVYDRSALPTEETASATLEQFTAGAAAGGGTRSVAADVALRSGWEAWAPTGSRSLAIAPQTAIAEATVADQRTIPTLGLDRLFEEQGPAGQAWFRPGDVLAVGLGTDAEWRGTVTTASASSLTFDRPVPAGLLAGTTIHLVQPVAEPTGPTDPTDPTTPSVPGGLTAPGTEPTAPAPGAAPGPTTGSGSGTLPRTGSDARQLGALGFALVLGGLCLRHLRRRPAT